MASTGCVCSVWLCGGSGGLSYNFKVPLLIELNGMGPKMVPLHIILLLVWLIWDSLYQFSDCVRTM